MEQPETSDWTRNLTVMDRCDGCSAQAFVRVRKVVDGQERVLLFCGHHFKRYELQLTADGWEVDDFRHLINESPSVSANATS